MAFPSLAFEAKRVNQDTVFQLCVELEDEI